MSKTLDSDLMWLYKSGLLVRARVGVWSVASMEECAQTGNRNKHQVNMSSGYARRGDFQCQASFRLKI